MNPADLGTIEVYRGEDWSWTILNLFNSTPIDMTGFGTVWTSEARVTVTATDEVTIAVDATSAATGLITLSLTRVQTMVDAQSLGFDVFCATSNNSRLLAVYTGTLAFSGVYTRA